MSYKLISFYSEPTPHSVYYTDHANRFISECEKFNIDFYVENLKSQNDYFKNTLMKPKFILDCLEKFNMPVLWLDIDSYILHSPDFKLKEATEFGGVKRFSPIKNDFPIFAHCLYFKNTKNIQNLLKEWIYNCENSTKEFVGDHSILVRTIREFDIDIHYIQDFTKYTISRNNLKEIKRYSNKSKKFLDWRNKVKK